MPVATRKRWMQGVKRSEWSFHWQVLQRRRRGFWLQPKGQDGCAAHCIVANRLLWATQRCISRLALHHAASLRVRRIKSDRLLDDILSSLYTICSSLMFFPEERYDWFSGAYRTADLSLCEPRLAFHSAKPPSRPCGNKSMIFVFVYVILRANPDRRPDDFGVFWLAYSDKTPDLFYQIIITAMWA